VWRRRLAVTRLVTKDGICSRVFDASPLHDALRSADDDVFARTWRLKYGDQLTINHFVHHRRQLTVYLRLKDVPVPCLYGPTADEKW
jgi:uncharacterized damage-inducible protein DinB